MSEDYNVDAQAVARRCSVRSPDYSQLTSLDWVVLDFTDGLRTFESLLSSIPTTKADLVASFIHLRRLGFLTWNNPDKTQISFMQSHTSSPSNSGLRMTANGSRSLGDSRPPHHNEWSSLNNEVKSAVSLAPTLGSFSDEVYAQYLPPRLKNTFKLFKPTLLDQSLDLSVEMQYFTEFLYNNLSSLTPYDLLGLTEGHCTKADVKQAYILRTKQFHPDRYFRKNIGPFGPKIAAIFKAVASAFTTLQSKLKA